MVNIFDKIRGALYGVAVGDALGAPLEFMNKEDIQRKYGIVRDMLPGGWLNVIPGEVTDDTQMTLAVAEGIIADPKDPVPEIGKRFISWYKSNPKDIGGMCAASITGAIVLGDGQSYISTRTWHKAALQAFSKSSGEGNGALMRTIYTGLYYKNKREAIERTGDIAVMTHAGEKSKTACILYVDMIYSLLESGGPVPGKEIIRSIADSSKEYAIDYINDEAPEPTGYVCDSLKNALRAIYSADTAEDAIIMAVNRGGDADTIGAITGGLAGALYGFEALPDRWTSRLAIEVRVMLDYLAELAYSNRRKYHMAYGRKMKGRERRIPITVHVGMDLLEKIDEYVDTQHAEKPAYSRSDFYSDAAQKILTAAGLWADEPEE